MIKFSLFFGNGLYLVSCMVRVMGDVQVAGKGESDVGFVRFVLRGLS